MKQNNFINRKAKFDFDFLELYTSGILLQGTEIKSIRQGKVSFTDTYCFFNGLELYIKNLYIGEYDMAFTNHEPLRERKLLLTKEELTKIKKKVEEKGLSIIPSKLFIDNKGWAKIEIAVAKGKKKFDKRNSIKEKDVKRDIERSVKNV